MKRIQINEKIRYNTIQNLITIVISSYSQNPILKNLNYLIYYLNINQIKLTHEKMYVLFQIRINSKQL